MSSRVVLAPCLLFAAAAFATAGSCLGRGAGAGAEAGNETPLAASVLALYADIAHRAYTDAAAGAVALLAAVDQFRAAPSADGLRAARDAWLAARTPYLQSEAFRFYDGPIDRVEMFVNTWPIDELYVESTFESEAGPGAAAARPGIIDDTGTYPELSTALLLSMNAKEGETSISTGYHVIEYLLWGRDRRADGPGDRPFTDYVVAERIPGTATAGDTGAAPGHGPTPAAGSRSPGRAG